MTNFDPTAVFLNYGILGVMFLLVLSGWIVTKGQYVREREISDTILANNTRLVESTEKMAAAWEATARTRAGAGG